jgi:hypothetical protein
MKTKIKNHKLKASVILVALLGTIVIASGTTSAYVQVFDIDGKPVDLPPDVVSLTGTEDDPDPEYWVDYIKNGGLRCFPDVSDSDKDPFPKPIIDIKDIRGFTGSITIQKIVIDPNQPLNDVIRGYIFIEINGKVYIIPFEIKT